MMTKSEVQNHIADMPDEFSLDELIDRLIFIDKVSRGIDESKRGETIADGELDDEIRQWFA
jgi:hypothetical protein